MPFKSKAQRRKFAQLLVDGEISDEVYEEWNRSKAGPTTRRRSAARKTSSRTTTKE